MSAPKTGFSLSDPIRLTPTRQLRLLTVIAVAALGLVLAIWAVAGLFHRVPPRPPADPPGTFHPTPQQLHSLSFERIGASALGDLTSATGTITADGDLSTPVLLPYSGQVVRVLVDSGQVVTRGQPLLTVRTSDFVDARNALFAADAALRSSQAQLLNAQRNAERAKALAETAGGARKDDQQAQTDLAAAQAQERSTEAAVGAARDKLAILGKSPAEIQRLEQVREVSGLHEETALHAPIGGTIAARDVSPGEYVGAGGDKPVFTITDPSRVWLVAQLSEGDASAVHVGDSADVTTPAYPGRVFHAVIDLVGAGLDPATHRLPVRATIANADHALKPEMFASFAIRHTSAGPRLYVPATAVIHEGETARVWILTPDRRLEALAVATGEEQDGRVEIIGGLRPGETIVTAGAIFVNEAGLGT